MFFVISGYCIAATADAQRLKNRTLWDYFRRRFRRIYPPYWIWLVLSIVGMLAVESYWQQGILTDDNHAVAQPAEFTLSQWVGNLSLTEVFRYQFLGSPSKFLLDHAWTLCYEEQFYLVVGLCLWLSPRRFFPAMALVTLLVYANSMMNFNIRLVRERGWDLNAWQLHYDGLFFNGRWLEFAAGVGVYYCVNYAKRRGTLVLSTVLLAALTQSCWRFANLGEFYANGEQFRSSAFLFSGLLLLLHRWDQPLASSWLVRSFGWLGQRSYSLYLVHWPLVKVISHQFDLWGLRSPRFTVGVIIPLGVLASVATAFVFHRLVERRFLNVSATPDVRKGESSAVELLK